MNLSENEYTHTDNNNKTPSKSYKSTNYNIIS